MKSRVLFVDDDELVLRALRRTLADPPFDPHFVSSPEEALVWLEGAEYAAVVSDLRMPGMNGIELLGKVHELAPDTSRLILSAHSDVDELLAAVNQGAVQRYLLKPWDDRELRQAVGEAVERYELKAEIHRLRKLAFDRNEELTRDKQALEEEILERSAALVAQHAQLERMGEGIAAVQDDLVAALHSVSTLHDPSRGAVSEAVSRHASALATAEGLDPEDQRRIERAGLLWRLGPPLGSPAQSAVRDADLLAAIEPLRPVAALIRASAEHWDGTGGPTGASGSHIPRGARILAVAVEWVRAGRDDSTSTSTSTSTSARERLQALAGTKLDPALVETFLTRVLDAPEDVGGVGGDASAPRRTSAG